MLVNMFAQRFALWLIGQIRSIYCSGFIVAERGREMLLFWFVDFLCGDINHLINQPRSRRK